MPTAARLVAALCLAALGFVLSELVKGLFTPGTAFGWFAGLNAGIGAVVGWGLLGPWAGRGMTAAAGSGLSAGAALVFWGLFVQASAEMVDRALARRYGGPLEALSDVFAILAQFGGMMLTRDIVIVFVAGSLAAGGLTELAARRWR